MIPHEPVYVEEGDTLKEVMSELEALGWTNIVLKKLSSTGDRRRPRVIRNRACNMGIIALDVYSIWIWLRYRGVVQGYSESQLPPDIRERVQSMEERYQRWCSAGEPPRLEENRRRVG